MESYDVLIVGAGPTGLLMASELIRYGLNCKIIDKSSKPSEHSKALAIQPRTLEILHLLGLSPTLLSRGQKLQALNQMSGDKRLGHVDLSSLDTPFPFILSLPQNITEQIFIEHLGELGGRVDRECELVGLQEKAEGVTAQFQRSNGDKGTLEAKWVIGCDGAHSFVRKHLDLNFLGKALPEVFSIADVEIAWRYPHEEVFVFFNQEGLLAALPIPSENRYRLIFQSEKEVSLPTLEGVEKTVREIADSRARLSNPRWLTNFHVSSRLVTHYRVGNFFLAGDAAHIHSPIGGQGMNTGLQDAFNLAWKLAFVHQKKMSAKVLDSYNQERHFVARALLKRTETGTQVATLKKRWQVSIRNAGISLLMQIPSLRQKLVRGVTQLSLHYPPSQYIRQKGKFRGGIEVGLRMPNLKIDGVELFDLLKKPTKFFVLLCGAEGLDSLTERLRSLTLPIEILNISNPQRLYPEEETAVYVVRPDSYIGFRQTPIVEDDLIAYLQQL